MFAPVFFTALNHLLDGANWARARLAPFAGRRARIEMPPFAVGFEITADGRAQPHLDPATADVTIGLPPGTPFLLAQGLDKVMAGASVAGNAEFATELAFVLRNLRWDAEEDLAQLVGDIAAHRLMRGADRFMGWQKQTAARFAENLAEYLARENSLLVATEKYAALRNDIFRFNADLTRVENRLALLAR